jgi:hypothetical protein
MKMFSNYSTRKMKIINNLTLIWAHFWIPYCFIWLYDSIQNHRLSGIWINLTAIIIHCVALFFVYRARDHLITAEIKEILAAHLQKNTHNFDKLIDELKAIEWKEGYIK